MLRALLLVAVALSGHLQAVAAERPQRIVCLGDSITDGHTYPFLLQAALRAAGKPVPTCINAGVGGDTAGGMLKRLERDVTSRKPDLVLLSAGINDFGQGVKLDDYLERMGRIADELAAKQIRLIILTTTAVRHEGSQQVLDSWNERLRELAKAKHAGLGDVAAAFVPRRAAGDDLWEADGCHLSFSGYRAMVRGVLDGLGATEVAVPEKLEIKPEPGLIQTWQIRKSPDDKPLSAEQAAGLTPNGAWAEYTLPEQQPAESWWWEEQRRRGFALSLSKRFGVGNHFQGIAKLKSPQRRTVYFRPGADMQTVWLNGKRIYDAAPETRTWHMREEAEATLEPGENVIVAEFGSKFFLSVVDEKE